MTNPEQPESRTPTRRLTPRDGGFVAVLMALVLTVLMAFAAFSIDVGAWYSRASALQRAADAAALAGVVWMPNETKAKQVAREAAAENGFSTGGSITVDPQGVPGDSHQLRVTITDTDVEQYFSQLSIAPPTISRSAVAEYVLPVPLGSPENRLGNDPTTGYNPRLWASISGPHTDKVNGDPYSTKCGVGSSGAGCSGNSEYRSTGFLYAIDVPTTAVNQTLSVQLYDAGNYPRASYANIETADNGTVNTEFELFRADDTPLDNQDNLVPSNSLSGACSSGPGRVYIANNTSSGTYMNRWTTLCSVVANKAGQWFLRVKSSGISGVTDAGNGWNQFSLRATLSGGTHPPLFGVNDLSLFNNLPGLSGTFSATFYLAEVEQVHAGKSLKISLFDPGDGASGNYFVNVLLPGGSTTSCKYGPRGGSTSTASPCRIQTRSSSGNTYNGQWLDMNIDIPTTYTCSTDCWWRIRYDFVSVTSGNSPNDRTVWSATVLGDPVHLVE